MEHNLELALEQPKNIKFDYQDNIIEVKPYLSQDDQDILIQQYSKNAEVGYLEAEYGLLIGILDACTNIKLFNDDETDTVKPDDLNAHWTLIELIRTKILNYQDFRSKLELFVQRENSLRDVIQLTIRNAQDAIENLINSDFSDEQIGKIKGLLAEVNASPILNEATKIFKSGYPQESTGKPTKKQSKTSPTPKKTRTRKSK